MSEIRGVPVLAEQAFRRHYQELYRYLRRRTASREQAEDVAQEVFVSAVKGLEAFKTGGPPMLAWLYTVAQRRLADEARRREPASRVHGTADGALESAEAPRYGLEVAAALRSAIEGLSAEQRQVVVLKVLRGWTFAEVAAEQRTTVAASKMRLARALRALRDELRREGVEP